MPKLEPLQVLTEYREIVASLERHIRDVSASLTILEAGCGRKWPLKLDGLELRITGIDLDALALANRRDLVRAVVGDLRDRTLVARQSCDVVYSAFVLEHVDGAQTVLENIVEWARPGGLIIVRIPDRDSVYGFVARTTPFWLHVLYKRWIERYPNAGKPGFAPYPVRYDKVVSRKGVRAFCAAHGCRIITEHGSGFYLQGRFAYPVRAVAVALWALSLGRLAWRHNNLTFVIRKEPAPAATAPASTPIDTMVPTRAVENRLTG